MDIKESSTKFYAGEDPDNPSAEMTFVLNGEKQLIINHTLVEEELRGQGVGDQLLEEVVQYARDNDRQIIPLCPFAKAQMQKDKAQYEDVLSPR